MLETMCAGSAGCPLTDVHLMVHLHMCLRMGVRAVAQCKCCDEAMKLTDGLCHTLLPAGMHNHHQLSHLYRCVHAVYYRYSTGLVFKCACAAGKYPGDDSPVVWGVCGHAFHLQCITKWLSSQSEQRCPFCRRNWEYKSAGPVQMEAEEAA